MRSWQDQLDYEASEKARMRAEWVAQAAGLNIGVTKAAEQLGMPTRKLQAQFTQHGVKTQVGRKFHIAPATKSQLRNELRERAKALRAAGYTQNGAMIEAARVMTLDATSAAR